MSSLPTPDFYEPRQVADLYLERAGQVFEAGEAYAKRHRLKPASEDEPRFAVFGIDSQVSFCIPGASLFVPGSVEDLQRAIGWIYRNLDRLTALHFSLNTHLVFQIFHPSWWIDEQGRHPAPYTPIFHEQVKAGRYRAVRHPKESLEYTLRLEETGKYVLTIWPFHALLGGPSHSVVPALMEAAIFHGAARNQPPHFEIKGAHPLTENYSVLSPEVTELSGQVLGSFNRPFFERLMAFDRVYVFGEASSHCVLATLRDMQQHIEKTDPKLAGKLWILADAMSPVPAPELSPLPQSLDFPRLAQLALMDFQRSGMHVVTTRDPLAP